MTGRIVIVKQFFDVDMWRNKSAQFARDNGFDFTCVWTRESERDTGLKEHMHVLMHVPCDQQRRFKTVVKGGGAVAQTRSTSGPVTTERRPTIKEGSQT